MKTRLAFRLADARAAFRLTSASKRRRDVARRLDPSRVFARGPARRAANRTPRLRPTRSSRASRNHARIAAAARLRVDATRRDEMRRSRDVALRRASASRLAARTTREASTRRTATRFVSRRRQRRDGSTPSFGASTPREARRATRDETIPSRNPRRSLRRLLRRSLPSLEPTWILVSTSRTRGAARRRRAQRFRARRRRRARRRAIREARASRRARPSLGGATGHDASARFRASLVATREGFARNFAFRRRRLVARRVARRRVRRRAPRPRRRRRASREPTHARRRSRVRSRNASRARRVTTPSRHHARKHRDASAAILRRATAAAILKAIARRSSAARTPRRSRTNATPRARRRTRQRRRRTACRTARSVASASRAASATAAAHARLARLLVADSRFFSPRGRFRRGWRHGRAGDAPRSKCRARCTAVVLAAARAERGVERARGEDAFAPSSHDETRAKARRERRGPRHRSLRRHAHPSCARIATSRRLADAPS